LDVPVANTDQCILQIDWPEISKTWDTKFW
jgi:hypothetical protein